MGNINSGVLEGVRRIGAKFRDVAIGGEITGAPLGFRLRGATTAGPPAAGTWKAGDQVPDRAGAIWICTADGTPGSWLLAGSALAGTVYLDQYAGTDDQRMTLAIAAVVAAGGGTIQLSSRAHTFANQWTTTYVSPSATTALRIAGGGIAFNGAWNVPSAATTCTFTYSGAGAACMDFQHNGSIELTGIQFKTANLGVPFVLVTNPSPNIHDNVFSGGGSGYSCVTDAIIFGGTGTVVGAGDTAPYQGYQGQVYRNFFTGIRRAALFQVFANGVQFHDNTVSITCGSNLQLGACVEFSAPVSNSSGCGVYGNLFEMSYYPVGVKLTQNAYSHTLGPNGFFDSSALVTVAFYYIAAVSGCIQNLITDGFSSISTPLCIDFSVAAGNTVVSASSARPNRAAGPQFFHTIKNPVTLNSASSGGWASSSAAGDLAWLAALQDQPNSISQAQIWVAPCTQVTDGILINGAPYVVSSTAAWTAADLYRAVKGIGIPASMTAIMAVYTPATAIPWAASVAYSAGDISRPVTANSHLYQCTTAGTSGTTAPAWPTSGGTVTDGTAVWTDRGTAATAVLLNNACSATSTGVTIYFGRSATSFGMTQFDRHHILTTGGTPTGTADTGAGTSPAGLTVTGTDHAFTFSVTTGAAATAAGAMFHVASLNVWIGTPKFTVTAGNAASAALIAGGCWLTVSGSSTVTANFTVAPTISTAYVFSFVAMV